MDEPSPDLVDRVARAICAKRGLGWDEPTTPRETFRGYARAAIAAMRDPTDERLGDE